MFRSISILLLRGMSKPKFTCDDLDGVRCGSKCNLGKSTCCFYCRDRNQCSDSYLCTEYKAHRERKKMEERMPEKVIFT